MKNFISIKVIISYLFLNLVFSLTLKAVFEVDKEDGLTLTEIADGVSLQEVVDCTGCMFQVSPDLKPMDQIIVE